MAEDKTVQWGTLWGIARHRRYLIIVCTLALAGLACLIGLLTPKIYQCESVISLPESPKYTIASDAKGVVIALVNIYETRALINFLWEGFHADEPRNFFDDALIKKINRLTIEDIRGSNSYFKVIVQTKGDPALGIAVNQRIVEYLKDNKFVKSKLENERAGIAAYMAETKLAIDKAISIRDLALKILQTRNPVGFNPVESETKLNELWAKYYNAQIDLARLHNYDFVQQPHCLDAPVGPHIFLNTIISGFLGFMFGLFLAIFLHSRKSYA